MPAGDLFEAAAELLNQAAAALGDLAPEDRRLVTVGDPAYDCCPQLSVHATAIREADQGDTSADGVFPCVGVHVVDLVVTLLGCVPVTGEDGKPPKVQALNTSANGLYAAAWTMWCGLYNRIGNGDLYGSAQPGRVVRLRPLRPVTPQAGCAGWMVAVTVQLDPDRDLGMEG